MRWSRFFRQKQAEPSPIESAHKIVVFGGGSFGTAMGCSLARKRPELDVVLLLRDPRLATDITERHCNSKYLPVRAMRTRGCHDALAPPGSSGTAGRPQA